MINQYDNLDPYTFITQHLVRSTQPEAQPIICIKPDNPKQGGWNPIPLTKDTNLPENANLYICISSCRRLYDSSSKFHNSYRASIECASETHMFMLDDISTKGLEDLPLEPTWIIETSKGNHQCLYVLEEPLDDIALATRITKELPAKGQSDPGAKNCVRWARLPGGRNNKPEHLNKRGKGFAVRIKQANPEFLYTVENITSAFNITPTIKPPIQSTNENTAPIIESAPTGWPRHLSALLAVPADCDYDTWFKALITMHAWGEQGFVAFEEWSLTSTNPEHQEWLADPGNLVQKWASVSHHTVNWPWLQKTALANGWDYNIYSRQQLSDIQTTINTLEEENEFNNIYKQINDSYFTAEDLLKSCQIIRAAYSLKFGIEHNLQYIKRRLSDAQFDDSESDQWTFTLTDAGNLERFESLYENKLWYIPETKEFIYWDNNRWEQLTEIQHHVLNTIQQIITLENRPLTEPEQKQLMKWKHTCRSNNHIKALETMVRKDINLTKNISQLNTHETIIGTPSFTLNLETGIESVNSPDHLITMYTGVDPIPNVKCPRWDQFILEIMNGQQELAKFLQKLAGYCLYGGNPDQLFVILEGHGANGKTTFVNVLQHVFGNYACTAAADTLTRPAFNKSGSSAAPDIVRLYRKRLVICNEWNEGTYINESLIKVLSGGGDEISVRALYSNKTIDYIPEFTIMLATNHRPNIAGMDYGIWRRLLIIPFEVNFTDSEHIAQRDPHLEKYLKDNEGEGILNWLVEGYKMWQEEGIGTSVETGIPAKLIQIKEQYHLDMDTVGQFLEEQTSNIFNNDELENRDHRVKSADIYRVYKNWAADNGYKPKGTKSFSQALKHRGFNSVHVNNSRGFKGIRLLTPAELLDMTPRTIEYEERAAKLN